MLRHWRRWGSGLTAGLLMAIWVVAMADVSRLPSGDGPHLLGTSMRLANALRALNPLEFAQGLGTLVGPHPPAAYALPTGVFTLVGGGWSQAYLVASALAVWLCWNGIRRMGGGLPSALAFASSSLIWSQATNIGVDLFAAAAVVQALSWLVRSDRLRSGRAVRAWGLWMGLAFLTKYTAPLFLWAPCVLAGWWVFRYRRWRALGQAVLVFSVVAGLWYLTHLREVVGYIDASSDDGNLFLTNAALLSGPWWGHERLSWYPSVLLDAWGWPAAVAVLAGVTGALFGRRRGAAWLIPVLGAVGGVFVLNLQLQRQDRYLTPAVPLIAAAVSGPAGWVGLPVLAFGTYGAARIFARSVPAPTNRDYSHRWDLAGEGFPWVHEAFRPVSLDPAEWQLNRAVDALAATHGSDVGTVALMLDEQGEVPGFGPFLWAVNRRGYRWDIATVMLMSGGGGKQTEPVAAVFVGPFTTDAWPSRDFRTVLAVVRPGDRRRIGWLERKQFVLEDRWPLPQGMEGRLYVLPDGAPDAGPDPLPELDGIAP